MIRRKLRKGILFLFLLLGFVGWVLWADTALELNSYTISSERLPEAFDGYRIVQLSDLHATQEGENHDKILELLRKEEPDLIAITGDLVDSRQTYVESALQFIQQAVEIAPCYYVTGNHEGRLAARGTEYQDMKVHMESLGVIVLDDRWVELPYEGSSINVMGVNDPHFRKDYWCDDNLVSMDGMLKELYPQNGEFTLLLSHRPELFDAYVSCSADLVLSGHAHGGQIRLPFVGGLLAPDQGWFPKYDAGMFARNGTQMIVSRGLGASVFPFRFNNRPEIIIIELNQIKGE